MAKFRKKPVVVEASQWFKMGDHPAVVRALCTPEGLAMSDWAIKMWEGASGVEEVFGVQTQAGFMDVVPGVWIITGIHGDHYPCDPHIFELSYDLESE